MRNPNIGDRFRRLKMGMTVLVTTKSIKVSSLDPEKRREDRREGRGEGEGKELKGNRISD